MRAFERASGRAVAYEVTGRRAGDVAACWADVSRARELLDWVAECSIDQMCSDGWRWQQANPRKYIEAKRELQVK